MSYKSQFTKYFSGGRLRMVNQNEIVDYFANNPGKTEGEMQWDVYQYSRSDHRNISNKKYADRLRAALAKGRLYRKQITRGNRKVYVYYATVAQAIKDATQVNNIVDGIQRTTSDNEMFMCSKSSLSRLMYTMWILGIQEGLFPKKKDAMTEERFVDALKNQMTSQLMAGTWGTQYDIAVEHFEQVIGDLKKRVHPDHC